MNGNPSPVHASPTLAKLGLRPGIALEERFGVGHAVRVRIVAVVILVLCAQKCGIALLLSVVSVVFWPRCW